MLASRRVSPVLVEKARTAVPLVSRTKILHRRAQYVICGLENLAKKSREGKAAAKPKLTRRAVYPGDKGWDPLKLRVNNQKVFNRFREMEVIHARWAMLGVISLVFSDMYGQPIYPPTSFPNPTIISIIGLLLLLVGIIELYRLKGQGPEDDFESRAYPGKTFDFLGLTKKHQEGSPPGLGVFASWIGGFPGWLLGGWWFQQKDMTEQELIDLKTKELSNGRLAMMSFLGICSAALVTGKGPYTLLREHLADPLHNTIIQHLQL